MYTAKWNSTLLVTTLLVRLLSRLSTLRVSILLASTLRVRLTICLCLAENELDAQSAVPIASWLHGKRCGRERWTGFHLRAKRFSHG